MKTILTIAALLAVSCLAQPAMAFGGHAVAIQQRVVVRQPIVRQRVVVQRQRVVVAQPYYQQAFVQAVYAQPVVVQQVQAYSQPVCAQQFTQGYTQQLNSGCGQFFQSFRSY